MLKSFDKGYMKHCKKNGNHDFMEKEIHLKAMLPLTLLCEKNNNFWQLEQMMKQGQEVPEFRYIALETEFSTHLTNVLEILKAHGDLTYHFNIPQMLKTMKIPNWLKIRPFEYYLSQMKERIDAARAELLHLHEKGHLWRKYEIPKNKKMQDLVISMCQYDNLIQILVGDERKQDQFEFFYNSCKIIYDSALQDDLVGMNKAGGNKQIGEIVIPEIVAFQACMRIKDIQVRKYNEKKKMNEKMSRQGTSMTIKTEEENKEEEPAQNA